MKKLFIWLIAGVATYFIGYVMGTREIEEWRF